MEREVCIQLRIGRGRLFWGLLAGAALFGSGYLAAEGGTVSTAYPAPSGVYKKLLTLGSTILARDAESVGIGTAAPTAKLDVNGQVRIQGGSPALGKVLTSVDGAGTAAWQQPKAVQFECVTKDATQGKDSIVSCDAGWTRTGGGCTYNNTDIPVDDWVTRPAANGWQCMGDDADITAHAVCCRIK